MTKRPAPVSRDDQGAVRVAFALVNTLPCGPDNVDLLYNEGMARHLVRNPACPRPARERRHHAPRLVRRSLVRPSVLGAGARASPTLLLPAVRELGAAVARAPRHRTALRDGTKHPRVSAPAASD